MVSGSERPLKVALVLSGAVALGSYEAGVAAELLAAIALGAPITLDLVAGSSAGALIAASVVKTLVAGYSPAALERWSTFDLDLLTSRYETARQAEHRGKPLDEGLLSSEVIRRLCSQFVRQSLRDPAFRPHHPAPAVGLVVTLTNLDGLPGPGTPTDPGRYGEAVTFTFSPADTAQPSRNRWDRRVWERIALVARASAAFPGAFDPENVPYAGRLDTAQVQERWVNGRLLDRLAEERPGLQEQMLYADGGIWDNRPLDRAMEALPLLTPSEETGTLIFDARRCFLLVEPEAPLGGFHSPLLPRTLPAAVARSIQLVESSLTMDAASHRTLAANARLLTLWRFLAGLARRLDGGGPPPHAELLTAPVPPHFPGAIDAFYTWLISPRFEPDTAWLRGCGDPFRSDRHALLAALGCLRSAYSELAEGEPRRVLREVHVALASQLGLTQPWVLVADLVPDQPDVRLYGGEVAHFGAFLSRSFLAHDFAVGRYYARRWLAAVLPEWAGPIRPAPPSLPQGMDAGLLLANYRPLGRIARRGLALLARSGYELPAMVRRLLRTGAVLLAVAAAAQLAVWAVITWLAVGRDPTSTRLHALALAAGAGLLPLVTGFFAGLFTPRRALLALLGRTGRGQKAAAAPGPAASPASAPRAIRTRRHRTSRSQTGAPRA